MKKIVFGLSIGALLLSASCKKDIGGLPENSWSVSGKTFTAVTIDASKANSLISAADSKGSSLDIAFKTLPTANADLNVSDVAYTNSDVSVRTILSGNIVYNSIPNTGGFVSVRVNGGKYTVIMNDVKLVNADNAADTVKVSSNLIQQ